METVQRTYEDRISRAVALKCAATLWSGSPSGDSRTTIETTLKTAEVFSAWLQKEAV